MKRKTKNIAMWIGVAILTIFFILLTISIIVNISEPTRVDIPSRETRGLWVSRFDFTQNLRTTNPDSIKNYIKETFNKAKNANFNMIIFQVRGAGDAFYKSHYEPWSIMLTDTLGKDPGWDPLEFAIQIAHESGLELHAWINTFTAWRGLENPIKTNPVHPYYAHPEWIVCDSSGIPMPRVENQYISFSPGIPSVHNHILNVVREIVTNYNVDGIHFDYIRYPDRSSKYGYSHDSTSARRFKSQKSNPLKLNWEDWQREQITIFIAESYNLITSIKPWIKVSAAVIGKYNTTGWNGYNAVYQDARRWSELGKIDMIIPMIYTDRNKRGLEFLTTIEEWKEKFTVDRPVIPGIGVYRLPLEEILKEIDDVRKIGAPGCVLFAASSMKGKWGALKSSKFYYPALTPQMPWKDSIPPLPPENFSVERTKSGIKFLWSSPPIPKDADSVQQFVIYKSKNLPIDTSTGANIVAIVPGNKFEFIETSKKLKKHLYYTITALDDAENESEIILTTKAILKKP